MTLGYRRFAPFYDAAVEWLYRPYRPRIADALRLSRGDRVLDLACGTGQCLGVLAARAPDGEVVGVDTSAAMLARARARVRREGLGHVTLLERDATTLSGPFDAVVVSLGLTTIGPWRRVFSHTFDLLVPGGRYVIFDVHAERRVPQTAVVTWVAGADLGRRVWEPLRARSAGFRLEWLPGSPHVHGGRVLLASGTRAAP